MRQYKTGALPKKYDSRNLKMMRYFPVFLPVPLVKVDHASKLVNIGMMGNNVYGNCTFAAAGHAVQSWSVYSGKGQQNIPDQQIISAYKKLSPFDQGCYLLDVLNYWRKTGVGGDYIEGFVEVSATDLTQLKYAIQYFGSAYIGVALPDVNTEGPWIDISGRPNRNNGHCIILIAYDDATGLFDVATWGKIVKVSYAWVKYYITEAYAVLNDLSIIQATGKTPEGFNFVELQDDLSHLGDPVTPTPVPVPNPTPVPTTGFQIVATASGQLKLKDKDLVKSFNTGNHTI